MTRRNRNILLSIMAAAALAGGTSFLLLQWDRSPLPPDITKMDLKAAMAFEATDDFNKLSEKRRREFAEAVFNRLRELPFEDMVSIALDPNNVAMQKKRIANLRKLSNYNQLKSQYVAEFLQKFYKLPPFKRGVYLTMLAYYQELERVVDPAKFKMPEAGEFHADAMKLFENQPPVMKSYAMQFWMDLTTHRKRLGLKELPPAIK